MEVQVERLFATQEFVQTFGAYMAAPGMYDMTGDPPRLVDRAQPLWAVAASEWSSVQASPADPCRRTPDYVIEFTPAILGVGALYRVDERHDIRNAPFVLKHDRNWTPASGVMWDDVAYGNQLSDKALPLRDRIFYSARCAAYSLTVIRATYNEPCMVRLDPLPRA